MSWTPTKDSRIKKRDGVYWARFMKKGKRVEVSLDTKSFDLAKRQVEDIEAKILVGRSWKKERELFKDAWTEFLIDKKQGNRVRPAREKTLHEYAAFGARYYMPFFGEMRLSDIDADTWTEFVAHVRAQKPDMLFFNVRKYMQGFLTWAKRHDKILNPPNLFATHPPRMRFTVQNTSHSVWLLAGLTGPRWIFLRVKTNVRAANKIAKTAF